MRRRGRWAGVFLTLSASWVVGCATTRLPTACPAAGGSDDVDVMSDMDVAARSVPGERGVGADALHLVLVPLDEVDRRHGPGTSNGDPRDPRFAARTILGATPPARTVAVLLPVWDRGGAASGPEERPAFAGEHAAKGGFVVWLDPDPHSDQLERIDVGGGADGAGVELTLLIVGGGHWDVVGALGKARLPTRPLVDLMPLESELARLRADQRADPRPVILLSHMPLEATGVHGMGGLVGDATLHHAPAPLRDAIREGLFVGAIGGHEPELAIQLDASDAIRRSTKLDVADRLFLVQAGGASRAARRDPRRRLARNRGNVLDPEVQVSGRGLVVLEIDETSWHAKTLVRHRGRVQTSCVRAPLHDPPRGDVAGANTPRPWPNNAPCPTCDPRATPARPQ